MFLDIGGKLVFSEISDKIWSYFENAINNYEYPESFLATLKVLEEIAFNNIDTKASYIPKILGAYDAILFEVS